MNITKENIEVILYDYAEGNLSDKECKETEQYLNLHPEYKEMLDEYDPLLKIPEENDVVFANKEEFLQQIMTSKPYITTEKPQSEQKKTSKDYHYYPLYKMDKRSGCNVVASYSNRQRI